MLQQRMIVAQPPLFDAIDAEFNVAGKPIIFSFGNAIYNPKGIGVPPWLLAHEAVHGERQLAMGDTTDWWTRYINDLQFRFDEELPAHVAEYRWFLENGNRAMKRQGLHGIAKRLAGPLYKGLIGYERARGAIKARARDAAYEPRLIGATACM